MWNNTDLPLAHLITFLCYGTWLHGDERGSVDRFHNQYQTPALPANERWREHNVRALKSEPVLLNAAQRELVEMAVRETCTFRNWRLHAINVRTNHVHVVVAIGTARPEHALNALKANATRQLRQDVHWRQQQTPWADKGSKRYLWNVRSIERAMSSTGKATNCRSLTEVPLTAADPPATAGGTDTTDGVARGCPWWNKLPLCFAGAQNGDWIRKPK